MSGAVLVTRPQPEARRYGRTLEERGFQVFVEPLLIKQELDFSPPVMEGVQALIFTSAAAVNLFTARCGAPPCRVFTVGDNTAKKARALGFENVVSAHGESMALLELIFRECDPAGGRLIHVRGRHTAGSLAVKLSENGFDVSELVVYEMKKTPDFSHQLITNFENRTINAVTFFSGRTAENFVALVQKNGLASRLEDIKALCIGKPVLECVQSLVWKETYIARTPDRQGMDELLRDYVDR